VSSAMPAILTEENPSPDLLVKIVICFEPAFGIPTSINTVDEIGCPYLSAVKARKFRPCASWFTITMLGCRSNLGTLAWAMSGIKVKGSKRKKMKIVRNPLLRNTPAISCRNGPNIRLLLSEAQEATFLDNI